MCGVLGLTLVPTFTTIETGSTINVHASAITGAPLNIENVLCMTWLTRPCSTGRAVTKWRATNGRVDDRISAPTTQTDNEGREDREDKRPEDDVFNHQSSH